ncbi:MAG: hypothetical protein JWO63_87 [Frankiales bacterium]|nr:hypothetical protein [Frankiales bacterium]
MIVKPADGLAIIDPVTRRTLPPEGITVPDGDLHWERLKNDGDVTLSPDPEPSSPDRKVTLK